MKSIFSVVCFFKFISNLNLKPKMTMVYGKSGEEDDFEAARGRIMRKRK